MTKAQCYFIIAMLCEIIAQMSSPGIEKIMWISISLMWGAIALPTWLKEK